MYPQTPQTTRNFESNKVLAGVGALLAAIGSFIPFSGPVGIVHIVGIVLVLIAMRGVADDYKDYTIFRNTFNGFLFNIISAVFFIAGSALVISAFTTGFFASRPIAGAVSIMVGIGAWLVGFVLAILAAVNYRKAFDTVAEKSREPLLKTGGLLLLIGAALSVIFVGFFLMFIAWILLAVGFFQLKLPATQNDTQPSTPQTPNPNASNQQVKYCSFCGAENRLEASFCTHCGRRLEPTPPNQPQS